jgi:hypothetical protein
MKFVIGFFLLFFQLWAGYGDAHASSRSGNNCHSAPLKIEPATAEDGITTGNLLLSTDDPSHENPYVINDDDENEENIIRKHVSLAGYPLVAFYEIILSHPDFSPSDSPSFCRPRGCTDSSKYILQRVLRI